MALNAAMSLDGRIAGPGGAPVRLSNEADFLRVHRMRDASDAVLVGVGTVLRDDPALRVKPSYVPAPRAPGPLRVVLDSRLRTPPTARVVDGSAPTLLCVAEGHGARATRPGVEVRAFPRDPRGGLDLDAVLAHLAARGVRQAMVEGGSRVLASFVARRLFDEFTLFVAKDPLGDGVPLLADGVDVRTVLRLAAEEPLGDGTLVTFRPG